MLDFANLVTADGYPYRVLATDVRGEYPILIAVNTGGIEEITFLSAEGKAAVYAGYSLTPKRVTHTRYVNIYRAADGSFCFGSRSYASNSERQGMNDTARAIYGLKLTIDEGNHVAVAELL
jgi:hypothetical protein